MCIRDRLNGWGCSLHHKGLQAGRPPTARAAACSAATWCLEWNMSQSGSAISPMKIELYATLTRWTYMRMRTRARVHVRVRVHARVRVHVHMFVARACMEVCECWWSAVHAHKGR